MSTTIVEQLKTIIAEELDVNLKAEEIDEHVPLFEGGLGFDSIATVELIALLERHFGIEFSDAELSPETFSNLTVLADFIDKKMNSPSITVVGVDTPS